MLQLDAAGARVPAASGRACASLPQLCCCHLACQSSFPAPSPSCLHHPLEPHLLLIQCLRPFMACNCAPAPPAGRCAHSIACHTGGRTLLLSLCGGPLPQQFTIDCSYPAVAQQAAAQREREQPNKQEACLLPVVRSLQLINWSPQQLWTQQDCSQHPAGAGLNGGKIPFQTLTKQSRLSTASDTPDVLQQLHLTAVRLLSTKNMAVAGRLWHVSAARRLVVCSAARPWQH